jgi:hypothetical protein
MSLRNAVAASSGNLNGITTSQIQGGTAVFMGQAWRKVSGLSALVSLTAATSTITLGTKWQVSVDNSTWLDVANGTQNAAAVVFATGTAAIVTKVVPAPDVVYGYPYARIAIVVGVTTGATGDLYSISYSYRQLTGAEGASA